MPFGQINIKEVYLLNKINDNKIKLIKESHKYQLIDNPNVDFTSVTTIIGNHFEEFDALKIATNLVKNVPKYRNRTIESVMSDWDKSRDHGTKVHEEIEDWIKLKKIPSEPQSMIAKDWLNRYEIENELDVFSEVIIYSEELKVAGTIDVLAKNNKTGKYKIIDWKTSRTINTKSFRGKNGISEVTKMIEDCNLNHYSLQLSLYRYLLEEYYGIEVESQIVAQLKHTHVQTYDTDFLKDTVALML